MEISILYLCLDKNMCSWRKDEKTPHVLSARCMKFSSSVLDALLLVELNLY